MYRISRLSVIDYPNGQDGAILPAWDTGFAPQGNFVKFCCFIPYMTKLVRSITHIACSLRTVRELSVDWPWRGITLVGPQEKEPNTSSLLCMFEAYNFPNVKKNDETVLRDLASLHSSLFRFFFRQAGVARGHRDRGNNSLSPYAFARLPLDSRFLPRKTVVAPD